MWVGMSGPVASKAWSTRTLADGMVHVSNEAELAKLEEEETKLELELKDRGFPDLNVGMQNEAANYHLTDINQSPCQELEAQLGLGPATDVSNLERRSTTPVIIGSTAHLSCQGIARGDRHCLGDG